MGARLAAFDAPAPLLPAAVTTHRAVPGVPCKRARRVPPAPLPCTTMFCVRPSSGSAFRLKSDGLGAPERPVCPIRVNGGAAAEAAAGAVAPKWLVRKRDAVLQHEAGHFLVAHLLGLPVAGYVLSSCTASREARAAAVPASGPAGTLILFLALQKELPADALCAARGACHSTVLMAGVAAEALHNGRAEGGAAAEEALVRVLTGLGWSAERVKAQARFGVLPARSVCRDAAARARRRARRAGGEHARPTPARRLHRRH